MKKLWYVLIPVLCASFIAWMSWASIGVTKAVPQAKMDEHVKDFNNHKDKDAEKFEAIQKRVEDKLDKIQELLIQRNR